MMTRSKPCAALLGAAVLVASMYVGVAAQDTSAFPEGVDWQLVRYAPDGQAVEAPAGVEASLLMEDGIASGSAGCNRFSGSYTLDGSSLTLASEIAVTAMACEGDPATVEAAYLALLPATASWQSPDGGLQLLDADGAVILEYAAGEPELVALTAAVEALTAEVSELRTRVDALESGQATSDRAGTASKPRAPKVKGKVLTTFPDWFRDEFRPESERSEERNREVVTWRDRADDEEGFRVYAKRGFCALKPGVDPDQNLTERDFRRARGEAVLIEELEADTTAYRPDHQAIDDALPELAEQPYSNDQFYDLFVSAFNDGGESRKVKAASFFLTPEFLCP